MKYTKKNIETLSRILKGAEKQVLRVSKRRERKERFQYFTSMRFRFFLRRVLLVLIVVTAIAMTINAAYQISITYLFIE